MTVRKGKDFQSFNGGGKIPRENEILVSLTHETVQDMKDLVSEAPQGVRCLTLWGVKD